MALKLWKTSSDGQVCVISRIALGVPTGFPFPA